MFIVALFIIAKGGNNPNIHQLMNGYLCMNKKNMLYPDSRNVFSIKRNELLIDVRNTDAP